MDGQTDRAISRLDEWAAGDRGRSDYRMLPQDAVGYIYRCVY